MMNEWTGIQFGWCMCHEFKRSCGSPGGRQRGGSYSVHEFPAERKKIDIGDYYSDFSKFEKAAGWRPQIDLREGLMRTLEFFKNNITKYI